MFKQDMLEALAYWITEREHIRRRRVLGMHKPWSADPIMRNTRWCNVRRLDDAVSCSLFAYFYSDTQKEGEQVTAAALGRLINWPPALMCVTEGESFRSVHIATMRLRLLHRAAYREKVFTGAYVVPGVEGMSKVNSVCDLVGRIARQWPRVARAGSMEATHAHLMTFDGLGSFLAGQIVADLAHLPIGRAWPDRDGWAPVGPGSQRGMNRLRGDPKNTRLTQVDFHQSLRVLMRRDLPPLVGEIMQDRKLQAMDIQNCLCEFDKYMRLKNGEGTVRAKYPGEPTGSLFS